MSRLGEFTMVRKVEFMRRSEARIIVFLLSAAKTIRDGGSIGRLLSIDYIYTMKILGQMFDKGWVKIHKHDGRSYFNLTILTPIKEAKDKLLQGNEQTRLKG